MFESDFDPPNRMSFNYDNQEDWRSLEMNRVNGGL